MAKIDISKINFFAQYEGYIWMSDQTHPIVLNDELLKKEFFDSINPFVLEGQLLNKGKKLSYSIKYVNGYCLVNEYLLKDEELNNKDIQSFFSHRMGNIRLKFFQRWKKESDPFCEGMEVLQPAEFVFTGFQKSE